jgi:uncharacterized protein (DUF885 family)
MFADESAFWKWPTVYDALSVIGLALGIASIWYAWFLARKQLRADFRKAADEAVDRVAQLVLGGDLADAVRFLRDAYQALADKDWERSGLRLDDAASMMSRFVSNPKLTAEEQSALRKRVAELRSLMVQTTAHARSKGNRGHMPTDQVNVVIEVVGELEHLRGRLLTAATAARPTGGTHG